MSTNLILYLLFFLILSLVIGYFIIQQTSYGQKLGQYLLPESWFSWITGKSKEETKQEAEQQTTVEQAAEEFRMY